MYKILVTDKLGAEGLDKLEQAEDAVVTVRTGLSKEELLALIPEFEALIIRSGTRVDADILTAAACLKVVGRAGIGVDNVDVPAATRRGVIVMNTPYANSVATAEQTMALMLAVSRHTAQAHASLKAGEWRRADFVGTELMGKALGIIGLGNIGRLVARRAQAFGMSVIAYDPYVTEETAQEFGVILVDFDDLLAQADYLSLHSVVTGETAGILNESSLAQVKPGVIIVNVARGRLIDEAALLAALDSGRVRAAALDVYAQEPPVGSPLIGHPRVLHTPHLGASSQEAQRNVSTEIVDQVLDALRGFDYRHAVNLPFPPGLNFRAAQPYLELASKLGALHESLAPSPITRIEVEVKGETEEELVRPVATGILKGILETRRGETVHYISAPSLADEAGIAISQTKGMDLIEYPNVVSCRAYWDGGERLLTGVLFGGHEPRVVQVNGYHLDAKPEGVVLLLQNEDVPGVIGQVGTILAAYEVNIGEWRMGRSQPGGQALSFINLDSEPPDACLDALSRIKAATLVKLVRL